MNVFGCAYDLSFFDVSIQWATSSIYFVHPSSLAKSMMACYSCTMFLPFMSLT